MCLLPNKMCYYLCCTIGLAVLLGIPHSVAEIGVIDTNSNETVASFDDRVASFGPDFPDDGLQGKLVQASPPDACSDVKPAPGKDIYILLVARGGEKCSFVDKVLKAQKGNYSAVIVHNYNGSDDLVEMGGDGTGVKIPSTFVGYTAGMALNYSYNYQTEYVVRILESNSILPDFLVWPFVLVVGICFMVGVAYMLIKICRDHIKKKGSRLSSRNLKKIPVRKFKKGDYYDTCAICLDEYEEGEKIRVLPCDHVYHTKCIDPWLTKNKKTCPVCKRRVIPGKDADDSDSSDSDAGVAPVRAETTPLLQGNTARQYAYRGTTRFPRRAETSNHSAGDDDEVTPSASQDAGNVGTSSTVPTDHSTITISDSERDTGAVGGAVDGVSEQDFQNQDRQNKPSSSRRSKHESAGREKRENRAERKRKRPDKERLLRLADDRNETDTVTGDDELAPGTSIQVDETREERRERRRRKKEQKKASKKSSQTKETTSHAVEDEIEGGSRSQASEVADPQSVAEEEQGAPPVSIADGQDVRLATRARKFELNEVV